MAPATEPPVAVDLDRRRSLTLRWPDGRVTTFDLETLRVNCPCAECRGLRDKGDPAWPRPGAPQPLEATGAELVGNWGLNITWNDGHTTGIYAWDVLAVWGAPRGWRSDSPPAG